MVDGSASRHGVSSIRGELTAALDTLISPRSAAEFVADRRPLRAASIVVLIVTVVAVAFQNQATTRWLGDGREMTGLLTQVMMLSIVGVPILAAIKVLFVSYVYWATLLFWKPRSFREVGAAVIHAQIPVSVGGLANAAVTMWLLSREQLSGPQWNFGLNVFFPDVVETTALGTVLTRLTPFTVISAYFVYQWLRKGDALTRTGAIMFVIGMWTLSTAVMAIGAMVLT